MRSYTLEKWDGQAALATGPCQAAPATDPCRAALATGPCHLASDALFRTRPCSLPFEVASSTFIASFKGACYNHGLPMKGGLVNE